MVASSSYETEIGQVVVSCTDRLDGDFAMGSSWRELEQRRSAICAAPWTWLDQVHGSRVVVVESAGHMSGARADGGFTRTANCPVSVTTADCVPVVLVGSRGISVLHVGWRGALAGIIGKAANLMETKGSEPIATALGPCIGVEAYAFSSADLEPLIKKFGLGVKAETVTGAPALNMSNVVAAACTGSGWPEPQRLGSLSGSACTSNPRYFSHRVRRDVERQATVAWISNDEL